MTKAVHTFNKYDHANMQVLCHHVCDRLLKHCTGHVLKDNHAVL